MGPGESAKESEIDFAESLGELIAEEGLSLLTGGRPTGVMEAAMKGARSKGGETIGILPGKDVREASDHCSKVILTGMGNGRNIINVLSSDVLVFIGSGPGTVSEFGLALKEKKAAILGPGAEKLWELALGMDMPPVIFRSDDALEIIEIIRRSIST